MTYRIFQAEGPGNIIEAHKYWVNNQHYPREVSITFSSQFEDFCRDVGAEAYIVASPNEKAIYRDGPFTIEHRPKPLLKAKGVLYHVGQIIYGLRLFATAVRFRANVAVLNSGSTYYFVMSLFSLTGIKTIVILHAALWPAGYPPTSLAQRTIKKLDSLFFRWLPIGTIGVSPECIRQVEQVTRGRHPPLYQIRAQFRHEYFLAIPPPPPHNQRPFRIMYIGRVVRFKGVFDILEMAKRIEAEAPGRVHWEICGSGLDLEELRQRHGDMKLGDIVTLRGWTSLEDLQKVYARSHASIVPTRSNYGEGLAMTAAEAILAGRPVISNPVVPALEVLKPACVEGKTDDVDSYVAAILHLINDPDQYHALCMACTKLQAQFYDRSQGLTAVLSKILTRSPQ